jgi:hypothetical protein
MNCDNCGFDKKCEKIEVGICFVDEKTLEFENKLGDTIRITFDSNNNEKDVDERNENVNYLEYLGDCTYIYKNMYVQGEEDLDNEIFELADKYDKPEYVELIKMIFTC